MDLNINRPVPGAKEFYPLNEPSIGTTLSPVRVCVLALSQYDNPSRQETFPKNKNLPPLFEPLTIRGVVFSNRIFVVSGRPFGHESGDDDHLLVADVPVQFGQWSRNRLAPRSHRRAYPSLKVFSGSHMTIWPTGLCGAWRWRYNYGSYRGRTRGPHLTRGRGALDGLADRAAQTDSRLCTHAGSEGRYPALTCRP